ncbi:MAG: hypothetical protein ACWIPJ_07635, partial [Polaribacter sp.]
MKKRSFYTLLIGLIIFSCTIKESNIRIFSYMLQKEKIENSMLNINENNAIIKYEYLYQKDTTKKISLKYNTKTDVLILGLDT